MATSWFLYDDTGATSDPLNYNTVSITPTCNLGCCLCSIFAQAQLICCPQKRQPVITPTLLAEINFAISHCTSIYRVKVKPC